MKLPFKSAEAFMGYCHNQFKTKPQKGEGRPAIVPPPGYMNIEKHVSRTEDGGYRVSLLVAGPPNGFFTISETAKPGSEPLDSGDLVVWLPFKKPFFSTLKLRKLTGDDRSSWIGFVVAKIAPEIDTETGRFTILSRYQ